MDKQEIVQALREVALLIELSDPNPKKAVSYKKAAQTVDSLGDLDTIIWNNTLEDLPGIGKKFSKTIEELAKTGKLPYFDHLKKIIPFSLLELSKIPGLGAKRIRTLYEQLNVKTVEDLETAINEGALAEINGFGPALVNKIGRCIKEYKEIGCAHLYPNANSVAEAMKAGLISRGVADKMESSGGLHNHSELITDINFAALSKNPLECLEAFKSHYFVFSVLNESRNYVKVLLKQGIIASLLVVSAHPLKGDVIYLSFREQEI